MARGECQVRDHKWKRGIPRGASGVQGTGKAVESEIEIVIPESSRIISHNPHEAQFHRLMYEHRMEQRAHTEITGIDQHRHTCVTVPLCLDGSTQTRVPATGTDRTIIRHGRLRKN
ncbi:MAG: hypothetical protein H6Q31_3268 [Bacteroidetes bacterium]|nr:hypothetical protein [Bacteroidota bacterium]